MATSLAQADDFFFVKLRTVNNDPNKKIPCQVFLNEAEDLIYDPSKWLIAVDSFQASLGQTSLCFSGADSEEGVTRSIEYIALEEEHGKFASGFKSTEQTRELTEKTFSIGGLFDQLNPNTDKINARIVANNDGTVKIMGHRDADVAFAESQATDITMSQDLLDYLDMDEQPIRRQRSSEYSCEAIGNAFEWMLHREDGFFMKYTPLSAFAPQCICQTEVTAFAINIAATTIHIEVPDAWYQENGIATDAVIRSSMVPNETALEALLIINYQDTNGTHVGPETRSLGDFEEWVLQRHGNNNILSLTGVVKHEIPANSQIIIVDPVLRLLAAVFQKLLTPQIEITHCDRQAQTILGNPMAANEQFAIPSLTGLLFSKDYPNVNEMTGTWQLRRAGEQNVTQPFDQKNRSRLSGTFSRDQLLIEQVQKIGTTEQLQLTLQTMQPIGEANPVNVQVALDQLEERTGLQLPRRQATGEIRERTLLEYVEPIQHAGRVGPAHFYDNHLDAANANIVSLLEDNVKMSKPSVLAGADIDANGQRNLFRPDGTILGPVEGTVLPDFNILDMASTILRKSDLFYDEYSRLLEQSYDLRLRMSQRFGESEQDMDAARLEANEWPILNDVQMYNEDFARESAVLVKKAILDEQLIPQFKRAVLYYERHPELARKLGQRIQQGLLDVVEQCFTVQDKLIGNIGVSTNLIGHAMKRDVTETDMLQLQGLRTVRRADRRVVFSAHMQNGAVVDQDSGLLGGVLVQDILQIAVTDADAQAELEQIQISSGPINIKLRQVNQDTWVRARIISYGNRYLLSASADGQPIEPPPNVRGESILVAAWDQGLLEMVGNPFGQQRKLDIHFPTQQQGGLAINDGLHQALADVEFYFEPHSDTVLGKLFDQDIKQSEVRADTRIRLASEDHILARLPNISSLSKYSSIGLTSTDGFLFKHTFFKQFHEPLLLEVPIMYPYQITCDPAFKTDSITLTPTGDVSWQTNDYKYHQMLTNVPLRTGSIRLQLATRDGTSTETAELMYRGIFEVRLLFVKMH